MAPVIIDELYLDGDQSKNFVPKMMERAQNFSVEVSAMNVGQFLLKQSDKILWIAEKTAKWSCPSEPFDSTRPQGKPAGLIRPLPWLLFLPALILIRIVRSTVSFLSQMLGSESIEPAELVAYLQMGRRKLRALKYQGLRLQRIRTEEKLLKNGGGINNRNCNGLQTILSSFARAVSCQTPDVFEQLLELLAHQKQTKCSLNEKSKNKKRDHQSIADSDSDSMDDTQRLRDLMQKSFSDESDSDDEDFELNSSNDDEDTYLRDVSSSDEESENEIFNGSSSNLTPEKVQENGETKSEQFYTPEIHNNDVANGNNGTIDEVNESEEVVENLTKISVGKPDNNSAAHSSAATDSKSPVTSKDNSRDSSKENLSMPKSGPRVRSHRQSGQINRPKTYRNPKKVNGDNNRQSVDAASSAPSHPPNSNKLNHSNNHGLKTAKRPQI